MLSAVDGIYSNRVSCRATVDPAERFARAPSYSHRDAKEVWAADPVCSSALTRTISTGGRFSATAAQDAQIAPGLPSML